jgi:hypothetical protein
MTNLGRRLERLETRLLPQEDKITHHIIRFVEGNGTVMFRILSAVLRRSILVERTKILAGAWRIECVELSRTAIYGD